MRWAGRQWPTRPPPCSVVLHEHPGDAGFGLGHVWPGLADGVRRDSAGPRSVRSTWLSHASARPGRPPSPSRPRPAARAASEPLPSSSRPSVVPTDAWISPAPPSIPAKCHTCSSCFLRFCDWSVRLAQRPMAAGSAQPGPRRSRCTARREVWMLAEMSFSSWICCGRLVEAQHRLLAAAPAAPAIWAASAPAVDSTCPMTAFSSPEIRSKFAASLARTAASVFMWQCWILFLSFLCPRQGNGESFRPPGREVLSDDHQSSSSSSSRSWGSTLGAFIA